MAKYQKRKLEDLHSKDLGNRKFAKAVDVLQSQGYKIEDIKEYYEHYKFVIDGYQYQYSKDWKASAKDYVNYIINLHNQSKHLEQLKKVGGL